MKDTISKQSQNNEVDRWPHPRLHSTLRPDAIVHDFIPVLASENLETQWTYSRPTWNLCQSNSTEIFSHNRNTKIQQILPCACLWNSFQVPISGVPITYFTAFRSIRQNYTLFTLNTFCLSQLLSKCQGVLKFQAGLLYIYAF